MPGTWQRYIKPRILRNWKDGLARGAEHYGDKMRIFKVREGRGRGGSELAAGSGERKDDDDVQQRVFRVRSTGSSQLSISFFLSR